MLSSQGKNAPSNPLSSLLSAFSNLKVLVCLVGGGGGGSLGARWRSDLHNEMAEENSFGLNSLLSFSSLN